MQNGDSDAFCVKVSPRCADAPGGETESPPSAREAPGGGKTQFGVQCARRARLGPLPESHFYRVQLVEWLVKVRLAHVGGLRKLRRGELEDRSEPSAR